MFSNQDRCVMFVDARDNCKVGTTRGVGKAL
jgi:hypothetical protein